MMNLLPTLTQIVCVVLLIGMFWTVGSTYSRLPARIPTQFGAGGKPGRYGPRSVIWLVPAIAVLEYLVFSGIGWFAPRLPHTGFLALIKTEVILLLWFIVHEQVKISLGQKKRLGPFFWVLLALVLGTAFGGPRLIH